MTTVEDNEIINMSDIYDEFGENIGFIVDSVTKATLPFFKKNSFTPTSAIEKMLHGTLQDFRVILLKLLDRDNNLETISIFKAKKQIRLSFETQAIYAPLYFLLKQDSVKKIEKEFSNFIEKNFIDNVFSFKQHLYSQSFSENNEEYFPLLYRNSDKVIWKIKDKNLYMSLCKNNKTFEKNHKIVTIKEVFNGEFVIEILFTPFFHWNKATLSVSRCKSF